MNTTKRELQISPENSKKTLQIYKRLRYPTLALVCLISMHSSVAAVDDNFQFPVEDSYFFNYPVFDYTERSIWTPMRVLGTLMAKQNGHYQKCIRDSACNMLKYHEWFTYITSNGLQLRYNKDTFKLNKWSK